MSEKKVTSRQELRKRIRQLEEERDQLIQRLSATNEELRLHALWCKDGVERPSRYRAWFNAAWAWLTRSAAS